VSSLAIHHLDTDEKRALFADLALTLAPGGRLIIADLVLPATPEGTRISAEDWDEAVRKKALELDGDLKAFRYFQQVHWNPFSDPSPDPVDKPSTLFQQLCALEDAGLMGPDVHWMYGGHAIFSASMAREEEVP
jgi:tRNA (cmo5U34)-methyltransferase